MKDEIKEILDSLKFVIDNPTLEDEVGDEQVTIINYTELNAEESKKLLDYITTLQEENERLNKTLEKVQQEYTDEYNLRHKLSFELSREKDKTLEQQDRIDKAIKLLKEAGCYEEKSKQFCDDIWEELPDILSALEGSDK